MKILLNISPETFINFGELSLLAGLLLVDSLSLICNPFLAFLSRPDLLLESLYLQVLLINLLLHLVLQLEVLIELSAFIFKAVLKSENMCLPFSQFFIDLFQKKALIRELSFEMKACPPLFQLCDLNSQLVVCNFKSHQLI